MSRGPIVLLVLAVIVAGLSIWAERSDLPVSVGAGLSIASLLLVVATMSLGVYRMLARRSRILRSADGPVDGVELDEGGLRWRFGERRGYLPFRAIIDISHAGDFEEPAITVKTDALSLHLPTGGMQEDLVINGVKRPMLADVDAYLLRGGRSLEDWLAELRAAHGIVGETGYRASGRPPEEHLTRVAANREADAEVRAGAAHVVLSSGDEGATACILQTFTSLTPPPVVVAAALAAPGRVDGALLESALGALSHDDETAARALLAARAPHVRIASDAVASAVDEVANESDDVVPGADATRERRA